MCEVTVCLLSVSVASALNVVQSLSFSTEIYNLLTAKSLVRSPRFLQSVILCCKALFVCCKAVSMCCKAVLRAAKLSCVL